MIKQIPDFSSDDEEREFWAMHDSADYLDWSQANTATPFVWAGRKEHSKHSLFHPS